MKIPASKLSIKGQTTVPAEIRKMFNLKPDCEILWMSFRPGEVSLVPVSKEKNKSWADSLCGKYQDDSWDGVQTILDDKKRDMELEKRGFLNE